MRDDLLISRIKASDECAIAYIMEKYSKLLWKICSAVLNHVGTDQDIEECVADVFIWLWQYPNKFDAARGSLKSWLCIHARSRAIDQYRRLSTYRAISIDDVMVIGRICAQDYCIDIARKEELAAAINTLSAVEQEILIRRFYYEQNPKEIAIALDLPVKQIDNHLYRSKKKLRRIISRQGGIL